MGGVRRLVFWLGLGMCMCEEKAILKKLTKSSVSGPPSNPPPSNLYGPTECDELQLAEARKVENGPARSLQKIPENIEKINENLLKITENIEKIPGNLQNIPENLENIPDNLVNKPQNLEKIPANLEKIPENLGKIPENLEKIPENLEKIPENLEKLPENLEKIPENLKKIPENLEQIPEKLDKIPEAIQKITETMQKITENIEPVPENVAPDALDIRLDDNAQFSPEDVETTTGYPKIVQFISESEEIIPEYVEITPENVEIFPENVGIFPEDLKIDPVIFKIFPGNVEESHFHRRMISPRGPYAIVESVVIIAPAAGPAPAFVDPIEAEVARLMREIYLGGAPRVSRKNGTNSTEKNGLNSAQKTDLVEREPNNSGEETNSVETMDDPLVDKILNTVDAIVTAEMLQEFEKSGGERVPQELTQAVMLVMNEDGLDTWRAMNEAQVFSETDRKYLEKVFAQDIASIQNTDIPSPKYIQYEGTSSDPLRQTDKNNTVWKYCRGFTPQVFELKGVRITPNPPVAGQWATFTVFGKVTRSISPLLKASFRLRRFKVNETFDHCETHRCPVPQGDFSTELTYYMFPFMTGNAYGVTQLYDQGGDDEDPILCVEIGPIPIRRG